MNALSLPRLRLSFCFLGTLLALVAFAGCSNYRLGTGAKTSFTSLYVAPVKNSAAMPEAVAVFTNALRQSVVTDGRVALAAGPDSAEATLEVTLVRYERTATTARPEDTGLGRKFDLSLRLLATLRDGRSGKIYFENREFQVVRQIYSTSTPSDNVSVQQQAEYNTQPLLAEATADKVIRAVLDVW